MVTILLTQVFEKDILFLFSVIMLKEMAMNDEQQIAMNFWGRVEQKQKECGSTNLKAICEKIGIPYQTIANQKSSARLPNLLSAVFLAKELETCVEWLLFGVSTDLKVEYLMEDRRMKSILEKLPTLNDSQKFALEVFLGIR